VNRFVLVITKTISSLLILIALGVAVHVSAVQAAAATFTVTKTADTNDGTCDTDCSLREAVAAANTNLGHDTIEFNIPTSDDGYVAANGNTHAYWSLPLNSGLVVTDANGVFINGYSQSGASRNTASFGQTNNALLTIQVVQSTVASFIDANGGSVHLAGLNVQSLPNVAGGNSIFLSGSSGSHNNWFEGNFFGTDITGTESVGGWGSITVVTPKSWTQNRLGLF